MSITADLARRVSNSHHTKHKVKATKEAVVIWNAVVDPTIRKKIGDSILGNWVYVTNPAIDQKKWMATIRYGQMLGFICLAVDFFNKPQQWCISWNK